MQMYALRVFLRPQDNDLFKSSNVIKDIRHFEQALIFASEENIKAKKTPSALPPKKYSLKISISPTDGIMAGIVSKGLKIYGHDENFEEYDVDNYPPIMWFWDQTEQILLVEKKTQLFKNAEATAKAFEDLANNQLLTEAGLRAYIQPCLEEDDFWQEYASYQFVEKVEFNLVTPNLFGETKEELRKSLNDVVEETNASCFTAVFENRDGNLKLKNSHWVENLISWVKDGGGMWSMKGKKSKNSKYTTASSSQTAKLIVVDGKISEVELNNYSAEDIIFLLEHKRDEYTFKGDAIENDNKISS